MKLGRVKKICTAAEQLCVLDLERTGNMVLQWIGTEEAMYPMRTLQLSREQLQQVWELSEGMVAEMEKHPVEHAPWLFEVVPGQIDTKDAVALVMAEVNGYWALRCGEKQMLFVRRELFAPCMGEGYINLTLEVDDRGEWWVAVYVAGVLDALVRPVTAKKAEALHTILRAMAGRQPLPVEEVAEEDDGELPLTALPAGEQQYLVLPPGDGEVQG